VIDLVALADALAPLLAPRLGLNAHASPEYTSLALPPDVATKRAFARIARTMPGAKKSGRVWIVARDTWARHRHTSPEHTTTSSADGTEVTVTESPESVAARSGLRLVRGA
jgi:hypothetical protein